MSEQPWRVACVRIPRFPIGAAWRGLPGMAVQLSLLPGEPAPPMAHWDETPRALVDGQRLRMVSAAASRRGVRAALTPAAARARCADLELRPWDEAQLRRAITEVTAALVAASPQVTPAAGAPGTWWVGASGFAGLGGEHVLAERLLTIARRWHPEARVAVAGTCVAARTATWASAGLVRGAGVDAAAAVDAGAMPDVRRTRPVLVPPGEDAGYLALAPLALLPMDPDVREGLRALGLGTIGAFAALDAGDVERRWGELGLRAWRLARAEDPRRPVLARAETAATVEADLPAPAESLEPVLFVVRAAVERLVREAAREGHAVAALEVALVLDDARVALPARGPRGQVVPRRIEFARPLARAAPAFELVRGVLDRWRLEAPVLAVRVTVLRREPIPGEQGDLLAPRWRDPGAADAALARIAATCGTDAVVRPAARETHRVEAAGVWVPLAAAPSADPLRGATATATPTAGAPLRLLAQAEAVHVEVDVAGPRVVTWRGRRLVVERALGPERLSGEWWTVVPADGASAATTMAASAPATVGAREAATGWAREYWRCEGAAGELLVYQDLQRGGWYVQGWYD
jgi:protein ImuB